MPERVALYVDGANVYFAQKEALGWWIDWPSFLNVIKEGRELVSARWYQAYRGVPEPEQERFLHHLTVTGFAVRRKTLKTIFDKTSGETSLKGNLDIELAIDALTECDHYDTAVLVTGDSDFVPLVDALRARGKRVRVVATEQNVAVELRQAVGVNYTDLRELQPRVRSDKRAPEPRMERNDRPIEPTPRNGGQRSPEPQPALVGAGESLLLDDADGPAPAAPHPDIELPLEGETVRCRVQAVKRYGVFLDLHEDVKTLLHVKDMNRGFVADAGEFYRVGDEVAVQVVSIDWSRTPPEVRVQLTTAEMEY